MSCFDVSESEYNSLIILATVIYQIFDMVLVEFFLLKTEAAHSLNNELRT